MMSGKCVPKMFLPEAVNWSNYVLKRSPSFSVKDITPEEDWSSVKHAVHHFKVFGCVSHVHLSDAQRQKLDDKSTKCVFLGISEESKGYRVYDPTTKKVITSRGAIFFENEAWQWDKSNETVKKQIPQDEDEDTEEQVKSAIEKQLFLR